MTSILFHTQIFNIQENIIYIPDFYILADVFFRILTSLQARFSHRSILIHELRTEEFHVFGGQKWGFELKYWQKLHCSGSIFQICQLDIPVILY